MDALPPSRAALIQHIKRAVYQGGHCWGKMLQVSIRTCFKFPSNPNHLLLVIGVGLILPTGNPCGLLCKRPVFHPGSYYVVAIRKDAEGNASARKQL